MEEKIINKKTPQGLDSFHHSRKLIDNIQYEHSHNQLQGTSSAYINSSFLSETAPSIDKNLQTPARESSITNSVVSSIEIPSDDPTFKFDALKSLATCEISNLTNKLDSILLVLNETSKTLEKRDANKSKLLQDNFLRQEILSKDKLIT